MTTSAVSGSSDTRPSLGSNLTFRKHNFSAVCYNASNCLVVYDNFKFVDSPDGKILPPPSSSNYRDAWGGAMYGAIENFPDAARVEWKSVDGQAHSASVDIGAIFADQHVLHRVEQADLPTTTAAMSGYPNIFLEVNDRTVTVYMKALVFKRRGAQGAPAGDEAIAAWTRTY